MKDTEGFANREEGRFDVRSFRDEAPRVVIDEPKTDRDVPAEADRAGPQSSSTTISASTRPG